LDIGDQTLIPLTSQKLAMNIEQEKFLNKLRDSLRHSLLPAAIPEHPGSFQGYSFQADAPLAKLVEDFSRELEALSGQVHRPGNSANIVPIILEILRSHNADRIIAWDEVYLGLPKVKSALEDANIRIEDGHLPHAPDERQARLNQLDGVIVGLTGAQAGLADTGTLALLSGPGQGRLASLMPPVHIALLPSENLYPSLPAFLADYPTTGNGSNLVFIAGPSRTGDIEMTLTMGVHGPKEIHVIITL
jgi:L-lactate dehydrogenase complex protein LldG